jgi:hypothetical protein
VEFKTVKWKDDAKATVQEPVVDVHEGPARPSAFLIPDASVSVQSTLMQQLDDTKKERSGRSVWVMIRPEIIEMKVLGSPRVLDLQHQQVK